MVFRLLLRLSFSGLRGRTHRLRGDRGTRGRLRPRRRVAAVRDGRRAARRGRCRRRATATSGGGVRRPLGRVIFAFRFLAAYSHTFQLLHGHVQIILDGAGVRVLLATFGGVGLALARRRDDGAAATAILVDLVFGRRPLRRIVAWFVGDGRLLLGGGVVFQLSGLVVNGRRVFDDLPVRMNCRLVRRRVYVAPRTRFRHFRIVVVLLDVGGRGGSLQTKRKETI